MKLPKELQKRNVIKDEKLTEETAVKEMIKSFKLEFLNLKERFKDERQVKFLRIGDDGKFSFLIPLSKSEKNPVLCYWTEDLIEIYFGMGAISNIFIHLNFTLAQYKAYLKGLAHHEYGHILSIKTSYDIYSQRIASMIKSGSYTFDEIEAQVDYSIEEEINRSLKTVNALTIGHAFREFLANYTAFKKITKQPSSTHLLSNWLGIASHVKALRKDFVSPNRQAYDRLFLLLEVSSYHFVYKRWNLLEKDLLKYGIERWLELYYAINSAFQNIIETTTSYETQIKKVFEITPLLDRIDYASVVLNNTLDRICI